MILLQTSKKAQIVIMTKGRHIPGYCDNININCDHHRLMIWRKNFVSVISGESLWGKLLNVEAKLARSPMLTS